MAGLSKFRAPLSGLKGVFIIYERPQSGKAVLRALIDTSIFRVITFIGSTDSSYIVDFATTASSGFGALSFLAPIIAL